jgi:hypothetical protein
MKQGSFARGGLCCPARRHYCDPLRLPLACLALPGFAGYSQTRSGPRRVRDEEGLSSSHDNLVTIPRSLRREVLERPLQDLRRLP